MRDEKKERNVWSLVGAIFIAVMFLGSTIGFVFFYTNQPNTLEEPNYSYNSYEFIKTEDGWQTSSALGQVTTVNLPQQVQNVGCDCSSLDYNLLAGQKVYFISSTAGENNAAAELFRNIPYTSVQRACLPEDADKEECKDLPIRSCENATIQAKIIVLKEGVLEQGSKGMGNASTESKEKVTFNNLCLVLEGENLIKAADRAIYRAFGILE